MNAKDMGQEQTVLKRYALRWAVLTAWTTGLKKRRAPVPTAVKQLLDEAQVKLSSGCFSSCEMGCLLNKVEGSLTSIDGATPAPEVDYWTDLVGQAMNEKVDTSKLLGVPSVKIQYASCFNRGCNCSDAERLSN